MHAGSRIAHCNSFGTSADLVDSLYDVAKKKSRLLAIQI